MDRGAWQSTVHGVTKESDTTEWLNNSDDGKLKFKSLVNHLLAEKEVKLTVFTDNIILYIENPKDAMRKLLELINEYNKVVGYKINTEIPCIPIY